MTQHGYKTDGEARTGQSGHPARKLPLVSARVQTLLGGGVSASRFRFGMAESLGNGLMAMDQRPSAISSPW
ncbi:hypothetical protein MITS9509_02826 [Synechococcus sp. MIT S9509]|nr:hypothetical protein MITS9504_02536 [Synechococcus sp. MIT S9504]KZR90141.1 hypothetical protein MITS9509_02826 [Synechococcus sp. MIT S9509]